MTLSSRADRLAPVAAGEQLALALAVRIAERDAHQEAIELRLGQGIGAELVGRVLGRDDEERHRQRARLALDRDLVLFHRLEQRALRLRPGAVDLVGEEHVREHRPGVKNERFLGPLVDADADQVRRHQVGGELGARELAGRARPRSRAPGSSCRPRERPRSGGGRRRACRRRSPRSAASCRR